MTVAVHSRNQSIRPYLHHLISYVLFLKWSDSLYAEQVVISKRRVKAADLIIRKRKVTEKSKAALDLITEQLTIENPTAGMSTAENDVN